MKVINNMKSEKIIQETLQEAEEEVQHLRDRLKKIVNETPQYTYDIAELSLKLSIATEKQRILSWIIRS